MGLDTSHDCFHGAYSSFSRFRQEIAKLAGYAVWEVNFSGTYPRETIMLDWGHITEANLFGDWEETPSDPLIVLFAHSDCEGKIYPTQAKPLAERLMQLLPKMEEIDLGGHVGNLKLKTQKFIDGLLAAVAANEPVEFH